MIHLKKIYFDRKNLACLVCGVDSKPVLTFFLWMIGAGVLASLCFLIWGYSTGKFNSEDSVSRIPLAAEEVDSGR